MSGSAVIAAFKADKVFFVEGVHLQRPSACGHGSFRIEPADEIRIFDNQHQIAFTSVSYIGGQPFVVGFPEFVPVVGSEIRVIGRVQEDKVLP